MSTAGKRPLRKDKNFGIGDIFAEQDTKKAALEKEKQAESAEVNNIEKPETKDVIETKQKEDKPKSEQNRGGGTKKSTAKPKNPEILFFKEKKKRYQSKSVYISTDNIEFIKQQSELNGLSFSEVLEQIIENFRGNI